MKKKKPNNLIGKCVKVKTIKEVSGFRGGEQKTEEWEVVKRGNCYCRSTACEEDHEAYSYEQVKRIVNKFLSRQKDALEEKLAHKTKDGYCCACDYDIVCLEEKRQDYKNAMNMVCERSKKAELPIDKNKKMTAEDGLTLLWAKVQGYNQALDDVLSKLSKLP